MENNLLFKNKVVYLQHKRTTKNKIITVVKV